jgi:hypothetical protein
MLTGVWKDASTGVRARGPSSSGSGSRQATAACVACDLVLLINGALLSTILRCLNARTGTYSMPAGRGALGWD